MTRKEFLIGLGASASASIIGQPGAALAASSRGLLAAGGGRRIVTATPGTSGPRFDLCATMRRLGEAGELTNGTTINLGGHSWNLFPEEAQETLIWPSNNDSGVVKTPFCLENLKDITIDGQGSSLIVRGTPQTGSGRVVVGYTSMVPFVIRNCDNITLKNFSIDWATPAIVQGMCVSADLTNGSFDVDFDADRKLLCSDGFLFLIGEGWTYPVHRLMMVDPQTGATTHDGGDNLGAGYDVNWQTELVSGNRIRFRGPKAAHAKVGAMILGWCSTFHTGARSAPAIFLEDCRSVRLEKVKLHHAWAMGVIGQGCTDVSLSEVIVEPSGNRRFTLTADATHFVHCRGKLEVDRCRFQNQFDDGFNAHGLYRQIVRRIDRKTLRVRAIHPQHSGVHVDRPGDEIRVTDAKYVQEIVLRRLQSVSHLNSEMTDLTFTSDLPPEEMTGDLIENITAYPEIAITNSVFRWNRARGVLVNGKGPVRISNNIFENAGCAIQIETSSFWGESGPVSSISISHNTFDHCTYIKAWGAAVIQADPEFRQGAPTTLPPFHGQIVIKDNRFVDCFAPATKLTSFSQIDSDVR